MKAVLVLGIGQTLRGDDAIGVKVVETWAKAYPEWAHHPLVDTAFEPLPGLALLDHIAGFEVAILVDAVLAGPGAAPGSLLHLTPDDLADFDRGAGSAHGWGVAETLKLGKTLGKAEMPNKVLILGIGGRQVEIGADLSPEVASAIPGAVAELHQLVQGALKESEITLKEVS